jgi:cytochrome c-type biogenesis protein CcmH/NrfG
LTLEGLARTTYEETLAQHRYLADKRARAQRWEDAMSHWQRVLELEPVLPPESAEAFAETVLQASAMAQLSGRAAEAHSRLLDAVALVPERGDLRLRLAESFVTLGDYGEALNQYGVALHLLPSQAAEITLAMVRAYQDWGRGLLRQGQFVEAARLFRAALQLDSDNGELYFALGQAEFRRRAIEAAVEAFEAALTYEPGLQPEIEPYLTRAQMLQAGPHTVVIDFPPGATRIEVPVLIDHRLEVPFIVDTGATVTLLPAWAADMLGYQAQAAPTWVRVQTAGGLRRLPYASVGRLEIAGLGVSHLPVVFGDLPGSDGNKGLLGMDFLRDFALAVDHEIGRLTLRPR